MLDRVHPSFEGGDDAVAPHGMGGHAPIQAMGLVDDRLDLLGSEIHLAAQLAVLHVVIAVGVELDPVGPMFDLLAHGLANLVRAVHDLDSFRDLELPRITEQRIHARGRKGPRRDEHPGAGDDAAIDRPLEVGVGVHRAFGLEVADRREAVQERGLHGHRGADGAIGDRLLEQLLVVIGLGDVSLQQNMRVGVDQAGQDGRSRQVDLLGAGGNFDLAGRSDPLDALALDHDVLIASRPGRHGCQSAGRPG